MRHALAVLAGLAVGMPAMAALASINGHTAGGLPERYVPWARAGHHIRTRFGPFQAPSDAPARPAARRTVQRTRTSGTGAGTPRPVRPAPRWYPAGAPPAGVGPPADLRVSMLAPASVRRGGSYVYQIRLANRGPGTPDTVTVHSTLPGGVVRTGSSLPEGVGGYAGGRDATLVLRRLPPGRSATVRFNVRVRPKARGDLVARSRIASIDGVRDSRPRDASASVSTRIK